MQFNYSPINNCCLTQDEENLLLDVDGFSYSIGTFQKLADLHCKLTVYTSAEEKTRDFSYVISAPERQQKIDELNQKINDLSDEFNNLPFPGFNADGSVREAYNRKKDELEFEIWTSRKSLELYENASDLHDGNYQIVGSNPVLGEYDSTRKVITLYMNNIRGNGSNPELTAIVYVHEMMHAYLDISQNGIISEIEEPIVEYAMLKFFELFNGGALLNQAEREVEDKKYVFGIAHYGFGHCLFHNPNGIDWLEDYKNAKRSLFKTDPNVIPYLNYWNKGTYPFNDEVGCLNALYIALYFGTIPARPLTVARRITRRIRYTYQLKQNGSVVVQENSLNRFILEALLWLQNPNYYPNGLTNMWHYASPVNTRISIMDPAGSFNISGMFIPTTHPNAPRNFPDRHWFPNYFVNGNNSYYLSVDWSINRGPHNPRTWPDFQEMIRICFGPTCEVIRF